jgi:hypothetical protein
MKTTLAITQFLFNAPTQLRPLVIKEKKNKPKAPNKNPRCMRPVTVDGVTYRSMSDATKATGLSHMAMKRLAANPMPGRPTIKIHKGGHPHKKPVRVDGVEYESISAASAATGHTENTLIAHLKPGFKPKHNSKKIVIEAI